MTMMMVMMMMLMMMRELLAGWKAAKVLVKQGVSAYDDDKDHDEIRVVIITKV